MASSASSSARSSGGARCLQRVVVHKRFASVLVPELDLNSEQAQADRASTSQLVAHLNKLHDAYRRGMHGSGPPPPPPPQRYAASDYSIVLHCMMTRSPHPRWCLG